MATIPKLLNIPSAYKASKIYSQIPTDGTGDLVPSRASVANRVNVNTVVEEMASNVLRLDYKDSACPQWLFEPQRTNLILRSEEIENAYWTIPTGGSVTANTTTAPDGTLTADTFIPSSSDERQEFITSASFGADLYCYSFFFKKETYSFIQISDNKDAVKYANFDLDTGVMGDMSAGISATITPYADGWYRCTYSYSTVAAISFRINVVDSATSARVSNFTGNGSGGIYVWGGQLEVGDYATSYVKTIASQVTRIVDTIASTDVSDYITTENAAMLVDVASVVGTNNGGTHCIRLGDVNGRVYIYPWGNTYLGAAVQSTNGTYHTFLFTERSKILFNISASNVDIWVNGVKEVSTGLAFELTTSNLAISGASKLFRMGKFALWNETLTDAQALEETT